MVKFLLFSAVVFYSGLSHAADRFLWENVEKLNASAALSIAESMKKFGDEVKIPEKGFYTCKQIKNKWGLDCAMGETLLRGEHAVYKMTPKICDKSYPHLCLNEFNIRWYDYGYQYYDKFGNPSECNYYYKYEVWRGNLAFQTFDIVVSNARTGRELLTFAVSLPDMHTYSEIVDGECAHSTEYAQKTAFFVSVKSIVRSERL